MHSLPWQLLGYTTAIATAFVLIWLHYRSGSLPAHCQTKPGRVEYLLCILLISVGVAGRIVLLPEFQSGRLTSDENLVSIVYLSAIAHGEPARFGAEKIVHAMLLDAWLHLFGLSTLAIRSLSTTAGLGGLFFWYIGLSQLSGQRVALWATGLLSVSVFATYFGRLGLELHWTLFFMPLALWCTSVWLRTQNPFFSSVAGAALAFGVFTYPGFPLALFSISAGVAVAWVSAYATRQFRDSLNAPPRWLIQGALASATTFSVIIGIFYYLHVAIYAPPGTPLFAGGGNLSISLSSVLSAIYAMLKDLLLEGTSWYLPFPGMPFVEVVLWPFFFFGLLASCRKVDQWLARGVALSMIFVILLSSLTGPYPGMRRAIFFLLPFYYFAAVGITRTVDIYTAYFSQLDRDKGRCFLCLRRMSPMIVPLAASLVLVHPIGYQWAFGRQAVAWNFGEGFGAKKIPMAYLLDQLQQGNVVLSRREFRQYFDDQIYEHYPRLAKRYGSLPANAGEVVFLEGIFHAEEEYDLLSHMEWQLLTWGNLYWTEVAMHIPVCILQPQPSLGLDLPIVVRPSFDSAGSRVGGERCIDRLDGDVVDSVFYMGARYPEEALTHKLVCEGGFCDESRTDFIYTAGGTVSFVLSAPSEGCAQGCDLVLQLKFPQANRKSRIEIAGVDMGFISFENLGANARMVLPLPRVAVKSSAPFRVSIFEVAGYLGWDIGIAAVTSKVPAMGLEEGESGGRL